MSPSLFNAVNIRAEIQGLSETIVTRLRVREKVLAEEVEAGLMRAIDNVNVAEIVDREARPALEQAIKRAVENAARSLTYDPTFKAVVYERVQAAIARDAAEEL